MACIALLRRAASSGAPRAFSVASRRTVAATPTKLSFDIGQTRVQFLIAGEAASTFGQRLELHGKRLNGARAFHGQEVALGSLFSGAGDAPFSFGCLLLQMQDLNILLDVRPGSVGPNISKSLDAVAQEQSPALLLEATGVLPDEVDVVVHAHLHCDFAGWHMVRSQGGRLHPMFRNARHVVQREEWSYWASTPELRESCRYADNLVPLEELGMIELVDGEVELLPGLRLVPSPGHTPGRQAIRVEGGSGEVAYWIGNAIHQGQQISEPGLHPFSASAQSTTSQAELLADIESERVVSPLDAGPLAAGHMRLDEAGHVSFRQLAHAQQLQGPAEFGPLG